MGFRIVSSAHDLSVAEAEASLQVCVIHAKILNTL